MNILNHLVRPALAVAALSCAAGAASAETVLPAPETILCPPTSGDLDYGLFKVMESARFQTRDGGLSWTRKADGPFHWRSMEKARHIRVEFKRFRTAEGTRLILEPWWETSSYAIKVQQQDVLDNFQGVLDKFAEIFPCA